MVRLIRVAPVRFRVAVRRLEAEGVQRPAHLRVFQNAHRDERGRHVRRLRPRVLERVVVDDLVQVPHAQQLRHAIRNLRRVVLSEKTKRVRGPVQPRHDDPPARGVLPSD